jgi:peroxiredoxin
MTKLGVLIVGALLLAPALDARAEGSFAGSMAADWQLEGLDGRSYQLAKLEGKAVVLNFWATWCAPCRIETRWLIDLHRKYHAQGLQIVGISMDEAADESEVARFAAKYAIPYPILLRGQTIADRYGGIRYLPQMFFVDRSGRILKNTHGIHDRAELEADVLQLLSQPGDLKR